MEALISVTLGAGAARDMGAIETQTHETDVDMVGHGFGTARVGGCFALFSIVSDTSHVAVALAGFTYTCGANLTIHVLSVLGRGGHCTFACKFKCFLVLVSRIAYATVFTLRGESCSHYICNSFYS